MSSSAEDAIAGAGDSTSSSFSEAQLSAFWDGIVANLDFAGRMASHFVGRRNANDVVNSAALLFLESLQRAKKPARFPATNDEFRRRFLAIVRNHAIDCVRDSDVAERPIHSHWAKEPEPAVGGRKIADRALDGVFARNDQRKYDAPAPTERHVKDDLDELHWILENHLEDLSQTQFDIIVETFYETRKRADVAARHGITVSTYDNHLQAAFRTLRESMKGVIDISSDMDRVPWYDRIEQLLERHAARQVRRVRGKKGEHSSSKDDRSNVEGDRSNSAHDRGKGARAGAA